jgi:hypothetical protein
MVDSDGAQPTDTVTAANSAAREGFTQNYGITIIESST